jgi:glycosyltransferase involved in cell wall biosynthesis
MDGSKVAIIIPAFNEAGSIGVVINKAKSYGLVIVVDDGSTDHTAIIAKSHGATVIKRSKNGGYDDALNAGFDFACKTGCEAFITLDADGQHNPLLLKSFIKRLKDGDDLVIGVRDKMQRFSERMMGVVMTRLIGIRDPLCGLKAYSLNLYLEKGYFDSYRSIGTELCIFALLNGYRYSEIEFITSSRKGDSRFGRFISGNYKIIRAMVIALKTIIPHKIWV